MNTPASWNEMVYYLEKVKYCLVVEGTDRNIKIVITKNKINSIFHFILLCSFYFLFILERKGSTLLAFFI